MSISLEARIDELERQTRRLRRCLVGSLGVSIVALSFILSHAEARGPKEIVANSIQVINPLGKHGATLAATDDGFVGLFFRDLQGQQRMALIMTPSGKATLSIGDGKVSRLEVGVVESPAATAESYSLSMRNAEGQVVWQPTSANPVELK